MNTVLVLGDQLNRRIASLADREPGDTQVLMVESDELLQRGRYHRQRLHLVMAGMRKFAAQLEVAGLAVDYRQAPSLRAGIEAHRAERRPAQITAMEPMSWRGQQALQRWGVELVRSNQFLCHYDQFAKWADGRKRLVMEDFYREQRQRLGYLMDGDEPSEGRWNWDSENREPPPDDATWPLRPTSALDDVDREVIADIGSRGFGAEPDGAWATTRRAALARLRHFVGEVLPRFGTHQDAMVTGQWSMAHSLLSPYLNLGLLFPDEVCDAAEEAYRAGDVPIASAEGFIRQIIGWREYVWGIYWLLMPQYAEENHLGADRPLPPAFGDGDTHMACLADTLRSVDDHGYAHHIQRLMVLGNLALVAGVDPQAMVTWMRESFVDGADWVMVPNVVGMALWADGGQMATKPYAAGGNYINRMSDYCGDCRYNPRQRTGDDACPFSTLYWDFLRRNRSKLAGNHRIARQLAAARDLSDMDEVQKRATEVLDLLDRGEL